MWEVVNELFLPLSLPPFPGLFSTARVVVLRGETLLSLLQCANYCDPLTGVQHTHTYIHAYTCIYYVNRCTHSSALIFIHSVSISSTDNHLYVLPLSPSGFWFPPLIKTDFCRIFPPPLPSHTTLREIVFLFRRLKYHCS